MRKSEMRLDESPELGYSLRAEQKEQSAYRHTDRSWLTTRVTGTFERDIGRK
jgi:hypothetical protein